MERFEYDSVIRNLKSIERQYCNIFRLSNRSNLFMILAESPAFEDRVFHACAMAIVRKQ